MSDVQLPAGFTSVDESLPDQGRPVLAIRRSGYVGSTFEVVTALHDPKHRPRAPWRDLPGDGVEDSGSEVLGWRYADEWLVPTVR